jgi:hypothetical protein
MDPLWKLMEFAEAANIVGPGLDPLCGWQWVLENRGKVYPEQGMEVLHDGKVLLTLPANPVGRGYIREAIKMAGKGD